MRCLWAAAGTLARAITRAALSPETVQGPARVRRDLLPGADPHGGRPGLTSSTGGRSGYGPVRGLRPRLPPFPPASAGPKSWSPEEDCARLARFAGPSLGQPGRAGHESQSPRPGHPGSGRSGSRAPFRKIFGADFSRSGPIVGGLGNLRCTDLRCPRREAPLLSLRSRETRMETESGRPGAMARYGSRGGRREHPASRGRPPSNAGPPRNQSAAKGQAQGRPQGKVPPATRRPRRIPGDPDPTTSRTQPPGPPIPGVWARCFWI